MPPNLFLLDSGAFSVWNKGATIDLDQYIQFCVENPGCDYFVNLDVIPGKPNDRRTLSPSSIEESCRQGWRNYLQMLKSLSEEKVVPVFHMGDSFQWLEKYIEFGTPYIGISPANDRTTDQKLDWLEQVKPYIFDSAGKPIIKTHGFAVTSFRLMKAMQWHSVDSASWVRIAAYGSMFVPQVRGGEFVYDISPLVISMSPKSPKRDERQHHITTLTPTVKANVDRYIKELKMSIGEFEILEVSSDYKRQEGDLWWEKGKKNKILRVHSKGLMTCHQQRQWANMKFMQRANKVLPVEHIYFAGADSGGLIEPIEIRLGRRLMSYHVISSGGRSRKIFDGHMRRKQEAAKV